MTNSTFQEEFGTLVCTVTMSNKNLGDFSFHSDNPQNRDSKLLIQLLNSLDLCHHVIQPTHRQGHIPDWVNSRSVHSNLVKSITAEDLQIPDQFLVTVETNQSSPRDPGKRSNPGI